MTNFGSGISLDSSFDLQLNKTGDVATEEGTDELRKDLSVISAIVLQEFLGSPPGVETEVASTAKEIVLNDPRVKSVVQGSVDVNFDDDRQSLTVNVAIRTNDGEQAVVLEA